MRKLSETDKTVRLYIPVPAGVRDQYQAIVGKGGVAKDIRAHIDRRIAEPKPRKRTAQKETA